MWWTVKDSNLGSAGYEPDAVTISANSPNESWDYRSQLMVSDSVKSYTKRRTCSTVGCYCIQF